MPLFDYQQDVLRRTEEGLKAGCAVMVQMPTGTGKTHVLAALVRDFLSDKAHAAMPAVWVVAHRRELVAQIRATLTRFGLANCENVPPQAAAGQVCVCSVQWLARHTEEAAAHRPGLIVVDEAHHAVAASYKKLWTAFPAAQKVGFTATPCRLSGQGLSALFQRLVCSWPVRDFIARGRLALYDYVAVGRHSAEQQAVDSLVRRAADGDYSPAEMSRALNRPALVERLYEALRQYAPGKRGIVFAVDRAHAAAIAACYAAHGLRAEAVDSRTPVAERDRAVEALRSGGLDCLVNVNLFDEGFDCPQVEFIQLARPTLSLAKYLQMVGRGLRVQEGKRLCVLLDHAGLYRSFGLPDADRDWATAFAGSAAGVRRRRVVRGIPQREEAGMVVVANHSRQLPRSAAETRRYLGAAEPFEQCGRWGVRVGDDVLLRPLYRHITPFVGDYAAFELIPGQWGVMGRDGRTVLPARFCQVELEEGGYAVLYKTAYLKRRVRVATTLTDAGDCREWWLTPEDKAILSETPRPFVYNQKDRDRLHPLAASSKWRPAGSE